MKLALGPLLYYWTREQTLRFYEAVDEWPVDVVYLGETVCSRRHELRLADWLDVAARLAAAGKEVVLSSQALIESESDLKTLRRIVEDGRFAVEANDMGAVRLLSARGAPFVAGPTLNVFNGQTLGLLARLGATRWVMPPEMSAAMLAALQRERPEGLQTEVFAYGRVPLAYSARCFTARRFNLQKDACEFRCIEHPDGMPLRTREGDELLRVNGIQTLSARTCALLAELPQLSGLGVDVLRISPQSEGTQHAVRVFRAAADGHLDAGAALSELSPWLGGEPCNGFWHGRAGMEQVAAAV